MIEKYEVEKTTLKNVKTNEVFMAYEVWFDFDTVCEDVTITNYLTDTGSKGNMEDIQFYNSDDLDYALINLCPYEVIDDYEPDWDLIRKEADL